MTRTGSLTPADRERLAAVVAAWGADPARWPEDDRVHLGHQLAALPEAARRDAAALDALIASAASPQPPPGAVERLLARAAATPQAKTPAEVHPFAVARAAPSVARAPSRAAPAWMTLAASLLLGFWAGSAGFVDGALLDAADDAEWSAIDLSTGDDGDGA